MNARSSRLFYWLDFNEIWYGCSFGADDTFLVFKLKGTKAMLPLKLVSTYNKVWDLNAGVLESIFSTDKKRKYTNRNKV